MPDQESNVLNNGSRSSRYGSDRLTGKVALITGAAAGTGAMSARAFVEQGAKVILTDILDEMGKAVADELGPNARFLHVDVANQADWAAAAADVAAHEGRLDILVNNAAAAYIALLEDTPIDIFERLYRINCIGPVMGITAFLPLLRQRGGSIVNVGTSTALRPPPLSGAYAASKAALISITRTTALENGKYGVRANCVLPEGGSEKMQDITIAVSSVRPTAGFSRKPLGRRGSPQEMVGAILFLASEDSDFCTGIEILADGGSAAGMYWDMGGLFSFDR